VKRLFLSFSLILAVALPAAASDSQATEFSDFYLSRKVLGVIRFEPGATRLDRTAKKEIDRVVPKLRQVDRQRAVVRIEGVAGPGGSDRSNVPLAMLRAKAVLDYLREKHHLGTDMFLTGYGSSAAAGEATHPACAAEIALYEDPWNVGDTAVVQTILR
jgi:outer membrane protein OmpA-like peptidoglycan-associated protein